MIIKRDGRRVEFNKEKIIGAIKGADSKGTIKVRMLEDIAQTISNDCPHGNEYSVESIQDMVENELLDRGYTEVAKEYIGYRRLRTEERLKQSQVGKMREDIFNVLEDKDVGKENSNKNIDLFVTQRDYLAGMVYKHVGLERMPKHVREAHLDGDIYMHDMDATYSGQTNCCLLNLEDMFANGTAMNGVRIDTPKSFRTACTVATQIICAVSGEQLGGITMNIAHLSPYLAKSYDRYYKEYGEEIADKLIRQELKDGIQTINFQVLTLVSGAGQSPFVSAFLHIAKDDPYKTWTACIIKEIIKQRHEGMIGENGHSMTQAFPKLLYVLNELTDIDNGEFAELTKQAGKCSLKRMNPDYISEKQMLEIKGDVYGAMG